MGKVLLKVVAALFVAALLAAGWWLFLDGRAPALRPDLVRLPEDAPAAPAGYPTENAVLLSMLLQRLPLISEADVVVPAEVTEQLGIEYGKGGTKPLLLDLYSPRQRSGAVPGIIFIHGGGWRAGSRDDYKIYTTHFAKLGYVCATISYRFSQEAPFPAAVEDTKCAVRWMRANAEEIGVDPERMAVIGGSAGGYLALMAGYTADDPRLEGNGGHEGVSSRVAAVVDIYGPTDLTKPYAREHDLVTSFLAKRYEDDNGLFDFASPLTHLDKDDPVTFVIQGTLDSLVPVEQSDMLVEKLQELGVEHWYARVDGWPHSMDVAQAVNAYTKDVVERFFAEHLRAEDATEASPAASPEQPADSAA